MAFLLNRVRPLQAAALAAVLVTTAIAPAIIAATPGIGLSPSQTTAGSTVTVSGSGFGRKATGSVAFDGARVATFGATGNGSFSTSFRVPAGAQPGSHTVTATSGTTSASATLTVTPPPSPTPTPAPTATPAPTPTPAPTATPVPTVTPSITPSPSPSPSAIPSPSLSPSPAASPSPTLAPTADPGDIGVRGPTYPSTVLAPTGQKPQSKLWYAGGSWWGDLWSSTSNQFEIQRYDWSTSTWVPTGVGIDSRPNSSADTLWDGSRLVILTHRSDQSNAGTPPTTGDLGIRILRYSLSGSTWSLDAGFPVTIANAAIEAGVLDRDSTGMLWATWTYQNGGGRNVLVTHSSGSDASWVTPYVLPATGATTLTSDDISALVAYRGRIGVMWSNQNDNAMYFASHADGDPDTTWSQNPAVQGPKYADDHISLRSVQADQEGRVFAVVKTSLDALYPNSQQPLILLLVLKSTGSWSRTTFGTVSDDHTRPIVMLDSENQQAYVFATAPNRIITVNGVSLAGGSIYYKRTPMSNPSFPAGLGTQFVRRSSDAATLLNNATSTKQSLNSSTGLLVLASDDEIRTYMSNRLSIPQAPPSPTPTPAPSASPSPSPTASPSASPSPTPSPSPSPSGLPDARAAWLMDEGSGTTLVDGSGLGNNGTIHGTVTWVTGKKNLALRFDGTTGFATVPDSPSLAITGPITIAGWVRPERIATQYLVKKAVYGSTDGYELSLSSAGKVFFRLNQATSANTYRIDSTTTYPSNGSTWMHVAATYDGTTMRLYVNGVQEASAAGPAAIGDNRGAVGVAAQPDGISPFLGTLDEVRVWSRALSATEIQALQTP